MIDPDHQGPSFLEWFGEVGCPGAEEEFVFFSAGCSQTDPPLGYLLCAVAQGGSQLVGTRNS